METARPEVSAEHLALEGVRKVVLTEAEADRGYALDEEMQALIEAKKSRWSNESPPPETARFGCDNWT